MAIQNTIQPNLNTNQPINPANAGQRRLRRSNPARSALLAIMLYNPLLMVIAAFYLYGPSTRCVVGQFCTFARWNPFVQGLAILGGWAVLWLLLFVFAARALEQTGRPRSSLARGLRALSDFQTTRDLLALYAAALLVAFIASFFVGAATVPLLVVVLLTCVVCFWAYFSRPARQQTDPLAQVGGPLYQIRSIPPLRWFWPNPYQGPAGVPAPAVNRQASGNVPPPRRGSLPPQPAYSGNMRFSAGLPPPMGGSPPPQPADPGNVPFAAGPPPWPGTPGSMPPPAASPPPFQGDPAYAPTIVLPPQPGAPAGNPLVGDDEPTQIIPGNAPGNLTPPSY